MRDGQAIDKSVRWRTDEAVRLLALVEHAGAAGSGGLFDAVIVSGDLNTVSGAPRPTADGQHG